MLMNLGDSSTPPDPNKKIEVEVDNIETEQEEYPSAKASYIRKGVVTFFNDSKGFGFIRDMEINKVFLFMLIISRNR